ncbi:MAG TPA: SurA N-terminal domain-containing protein [Streptosporangiaceae bacterium]|nr:SurA N-terminal domain-containing protein [Streptosporangiaceae bacterium]
MAAAAGVCGLAVAACGTVHMGAAAIVGNQRVSSSNLNAEVANLNAGYQKYRKQVQLQYSASQMPQQVLGWIVKFKVRDRLAQREGITVTSTETQQALSSIEASIKAQGESAPLPAVAVANGLPPDMLTELGQYQAIETKLLDRLDGGKLPSATSAQTALEDKFNKSQCLAAKSLDIQINPQFGELDYSDYSVVAAPSKLSATQTSKSASKVTRNPPC